MLICVSRRRVDAVVVMMAAAVAAGSPVVSDAAPLYWDINGATANSGTTATGNWDGVAENFNDSSTGTGGTPTAITTADDDITFSSGSGHTGTSAVTVSGNQLAKSLTFQEGTINLGGTGSLTLNGGITISNSGTQVISLNTTFDGPQTLTASGSSQLTLGTTGGTTTVTINGLLTLEGTGTKRFNTANTGNGGILANAGTLVINNNTGIGTGPLTIGSGVILNTTGITLTNNNVQTWAGDFSFLGSAGPLNLGAGAVTMTGSRIVTVNGTSNTLTIGGVISGSGFSLTKNGTGPMLLSGANTFNGGLNVVSGTLTATNASAAGDAAGVITLGDSAGTTAASLLASSVNIPNPVTLATGALNTTTLGNTGNNAIATFSGPISLNGGNLTLTATGTSGSPAAAFTGGITGTGNVLVVGTGSATRSFGSTNAVNFTGVLTHSPTGSGGTTVGVQIGSNVSQVVQTSTSSQLTLTNVGNDFGALVIKGGTVEAQQTTIGTTAGGGSVTLGDSATNAAATFQLQGSGATFSNPLILGGGTGVLTLRTRNAGTAVNFTGGITGTGDLRLDNGLNNNAQPLNLNTNTVNHTGLLTNVTAGSGNGGVVVNAVIGPNVTGVVQNGTKQMTLTADNTYTGPTTVELGTLLANSTTGSSTGSGAVTVNGGALGGTGRIGGPVTITSAGTVSPGSLTGIGTLTLTGDNTALSFQDGGTYRFQTGTSTADLLDLTGASSTVSFGSIWNLDIVASAGDPTGGTYTLIDYTSAIDPTLPTTINFVGDYMGAVSIDTTNHAVIISNIAPVPEPATAGLLAIAGLGLLRRRRRSA